MSLRYRMATSSGSMKSSAPDFYCSNPDKSLVDRAGFLKQTAIPVTIKGLDRRPTSKSAIMGDFAIIHGRHQLYDGGRQAGRRALHRLLGQAERALARGVGACVAVSSVPRTQCSA